MARLPNHSLYKAAILNDIDYARTVGIGEQMAPTMAGFTREIDALTRLTEWVKALYVVTIAVHSGKAPVLDPEPRPQTAFDRLRDKAVFARHRDRVAKMLGR